MRIPIFFGDFNLSADLGSLLFRSETAAIIASYLLTSRYIYDTMQ